MLLQFNGDLATEQHHNTKMNIPPTTPTILTDILRNTAVAVGHNKAIPIKERGEAIAEAATIEACLRSRFPLVELNILGKKAQEILDLLNTVSAEQRAAVLVAVVFAADESITTEHATQPNNAARRQRAEDDGVFPHN